MSFAHTFSQLELGEFDRKAFDLEVKLFNQKYGPDYQPPAKTPEQTGYDGTKWRERASTPAQVKSSTDIRAR